MICAECGKTVVPAGSEIEQNGDKYCRECAGRVDPHAGSAGGRVNAAVREWKTQNGYSD